jgi:tRNA-Thr(GGU) m(6)t(6)A37 methyltransferase TsaA
MRKQGKLNFIGTVENTDETEARIRIYPEYCEGLKEINKFSHLIILYWIHLRDKKKDRNTLQVIPKRHTANVKVGVFACRSPSRPNPIGLSIAKLVKIDRCNLTVNGLDAIKGSPIIDIKPYIPRADSVPDARVPKWTSKGPST